MMKNAINICIISSIETSEIKIIISNIKSVFKVVTISRMETLEIKEKIILNIKTI